MAPTEGRVAKPERQWDCRRGTPHRNTLES